LLGRSTTCLRRSTGHLDSSADFEKIISLFDQRAVSATRSPARETVLWDGRTQGCQTVRLCSFCAYSWATRADARVVFRFCVCNNDPAMLLLHEVMLHEREFYVGASRLRWKLCGFGSRLQCRSETGEQRDGIRCTCGYPVEELRICRWYFGKYGV
jgi:hypothetical protein